MKFLKVNWHVPNLYKYHVKQYGDFNMQATYNQQCDDFYAKHYWPGNLIEKSLCKLNYECESILFAYDHLCNISALDQQWAKDNNQKYFEGRPIINLIEKIAYYKPDILYLQAGWMFEKHVYEMIRKHVPDIKLICISCGTHITEDQIENAKNADIIFTISEPINRQFTDANLDAHIISHAFDAEILKRLQKPETLIHKGAFFGSIEKVKVQDNKPINHLSRANIINYLCAQEEYTDVFTPQFEEYSNQSNFFPGHFGFEMFNHYKNYLVGINIHSDYAQNVSANIRLYETTGLGVCLLTDHTEDIADFFEVDTEIVLFDSKEEALDKLKFLIKNPHIAMKIGKKGQEKTLNKYTYDTQAVKIDKILKQHIG